MSSSKNTTCQNCGSEFEIDEEDRSFYEKVSVPHPTFCPDCRLQRRMAFFNLINLYRRPCDLCGKDSISSYPPDAPYTVYCPPCWWSDKWDPFEYGKEYDFSKTFFEQFDELLHEAPHLGLLIESNVFETSPYGNYGGSLKNCYLVFNGEFNEDCQNGFYIFNNRTMLDTSLAMQAEQCYDSMHIYKVNKGVGLRNQVEESIDCYFLRDSKGCQNCFASANLRNKKYHIFNEAYSKEDYFKKLEEWDLGSYETYQKVKKMAEDHWDRLPQKTHYNELTSNSTGNLIFQAKNCKDCFEVVGGEDSRYIQMTRNVKDSYDITGWDGMELSVDSFAVGPGATNIKYSILGALSGSNMEYSMVVVTGDNIFGSAFIKKGDYCILNKKYSKEEYKKLRKEIIDHMNKNPYQDKQGRVYKYGELFPPEMSPWAYDTTLAQNLFPISQEEAKKQGWKWQGKRASEHKITVRPEDIPDNIDDAQEDILKEVIGCNSCEKGFRITPFELSFLKNENLPLPRICPFCRVQDKLNIWVSEFRQVSGVCSKCGDNIKVPERLQDKKVLYCEACYKAEVV